MTNQQTEIKLHASNLTKKFDRKIIFRNISFSLSNGGSIAITGKNGSGKSTLIKILANLLEKSSGELMLSVNSKTIDSENFYRHIGFVSPYLNMYDEFSGYENLKLVSRIRGTNPSSIDEVLNSVGLYERRNDLLKIYSSGMKQRLKIAFSILHNPDILLLDEPTSNLDSDGVKAVEDIAGEFKKDRILVIATNDEHEKSLCQNEINLSANV